LPDSGVDKTLSVLHDLTAKLPVIVMTGNNDEKFADQAVQQGAQDYLIRTGRLRHF
jgi:FixJ family two-component response regulator